MPHIADNPEQHSGAVIGNGHCVALVRHAAGLPPTAAWRQGDPALGGALAEGTIVATFGRAGRYQNRTDGASHAVIFLSETAQGSLRVLDQWVGRGVAERVILNRQGKGHAADDASRYWIVEVA